MNLHEEYHLFTSKKNKISAIWHHTGSPDSPIIILHHGFTEDKAEHHRIFVKLARELAKQGVETFRFDFYGSGDSEGTLFDATFSTWMINAVDAANYVKLQGKNKLFTLGFSLGGFVAAAVAPIIKPEGLILWAPIFHPLKRIMKEQHLIKEGQSLGYANFKGEKISISIVKDAAKFKIPKLFNGFNGPVLLIHGTHDQDASTDESYAYQAHYQKDNLPVELNLIEGADHTFEHYNWENEVIKKTTDWLLKQIS